MGRILTACALSIVSLLLYIVIGIAVTVSYWKQPEPLWYIIVDALTFLGFLLPVPVALLLNLRDWWNQRKAAKSISERKPY